MVFRRVYKRTSRLDERREVSLTPSKPPNGPMGEVMGDFQGEHSPVVLPCGRSCPGRWLSEGVTCYMPLPSKATRESLTPSSLSNVPIPKLFDAFPELWAFLTSESCPDGSKRQMGRLSLSLDSGRWAISLTDPSTGLYANMTGDDLLDLAMTIEERFKTSTVPWRLSKFPAKKGK